MCDLTVIDKDGHARSAGATFLKHVAGINGEKCSPGESCCADVQCLNGHGKLVQMFYHDELLSASCLLLYYFLTIPTFL